MSRQTHQLAVLLPLVLLSACKSLPTPRGADVSHANQQQESNEVVASREQPAPTQPPAPQVVRQAGHPTYVVQPASYVAPAGHHHAVGQPCPHCGPGTLPPFAFTGPPMDPNLPWKPDGIKCPWPVDEYICDGGDLNDDVYVKQDWSVVGLDQEDTVAHFDTLDGRTEVTKSNCVCIYAPRFAAVRQVSVPVLQETHERMADVVLPQKVNIHEENRGPKTAIQPEQLVAQVGLDQAQAFRERNRGLLVDQATRLVLAAEAFLPYENLLLIQRGQFDASEKARLAQRTAAAIVWTDNQAVQVLIEGLPAVEARGLAKPEVTYTYEMEGHPRLRLCKIADKSEAKPGEIISFTLRFDNIGDQKIGNVTIIDHLIPRLEFVAGSAESTLKASFSTQEQTGESTVLRWEIEDPLDVNQGGIIRFQARVR